ncbi:protoheme IX farnesyltransferase [Geomesophilobacter sediminis]|uniref:Protoheme IX farnesyltransferase n=1 Tax=Geomesophilobacter sediminis TaxID=2798584 RepID=A0A8J7JHU3_9BACT|nr:protoheme IX farnesyltransferase [Geomesophilobacter sediminis]MBJ6724035.1 protoheme IX farnesyltransferase [Geomesophilobacter sediminis]
MIGRGAGVAAAKPPAATEICRALYRLAKPRIVAAIALSGATALTVAAQRPPHFSKLLPCLLALLCTGAASAMINCVVEADRDLKMGRLAQRNEALAVAGPRLILGVAAALLTAGVAIAAGFLGPAPTLLLCGGVFGYTVCYTLFLKPQTPWAAVLGGLPGAFPVLVGGSASGNPPGLGVLILFLILMLWQPPHFWLLALSHRNDYHAALLPVLPIARSIDATRRAILTWVALLTGATLLLPATGYASACYGTMALVAGASFWGCCYWSLLGKGPLRFAFRCSVMYLLILFAAIIVDICFIPR